MKKRVIYLLVFVLTFSLTGVKAQLVSKSGQGTVSSQLSGNRGSDIDAFAMAKSRLESAYRTANKAGVQEARTRLLNLATTEIQRTGKNLYDIKTGKLTANPNTGEAFNKKLEIQTLTDRLGREKYLYNKLKDFNLDMSITNQRELAGIRGNLSEFLNLMKTNYRKYDKMLPKTQGNQGTASLKNHKYTGGGQMVHMTHNKPAKPAKNNLPPSYFRRMENRQIESFNRLRAGKNKKAQTLIDEFDTYIAKGAYDKAANLLPEATALVHSDIRAGQKFLERAGKFQYIKFDKTALENGIKQEQAIEQKLNGIKISKPDEIKQAKNEVVKLLNEFRKLAVDVK